MAVPPADAGVPLLHEAKEGRGGARGRPSWVSPGTRRLRGAAHPYPGHGPFPDPGGEPPRGHPWGAGTPSRGCTSIPGTRSLVCHRPSSLGFSGPGLGVEDFRKFRAVRLLEINTDGVEVSRAGAGGSGLGCSSAGAARGGRPRRRSRESPTRTDVLGFGFPGGGPAGEVKTGFRVSPGSAGSGAVLRPCWVPRSEPSHHALGEGAGTEIGAGLA